MTSAEIRQKFLDYFAANGHAIVASSPLVPGNDPTLLFTNSGMVQFKDVFLGQDQRPYKRATTAQRCVRAGGKHNDLENVGYTARHHTFFEMLGNFSFGDYFKRDAIRFAWELLTKVYGMPADRLWTTVYIDDDEAFDIWTKDIGVPAARCVRIGDKPGGAQYNSDNFWQMADTGPCGPCSEIFYDHGPEVAGGPPGSPDADGDRYIEIWNLVFMQYNRDENGVLHQLPRPRSIPAWGWSALAAVLQGVHSNYEIDLFQDLIEAAAQATGATDLHSNSLKVIADHIRACAFLIVDGVIPGADGRGYVLRRIIRRAIRHGYKLGRKQPFFHRLVGDLCAAMGDAYPELPAAEQKVAAVLKQEEERFAETIEHGMAILEDALAAGGKTLDGEHRFQALRHLRLPARSDRRHRARARCQGRPGRLRRGDGAPARDGARRLAFQDEGQRSTTPARPTRFLGYERLDTEAKVLALYHEGTEVHSLLPGESGVVVLDRTPFYAESGGQVGDTRRTHETWCVLDVVQGRRHAEDPGRRVRPPWRTHQWRACRRRCRGGAGGPGGARSARHGTTRPPI